MWKSSLRGWVTACLCAIVLLAGGCATIKRLNPWSSPDADTAPADLPAPSPGTAATDGKAPSGAPLTTTQQTPETGTDAEALDLSLPSSARTTSASVAGPIPSTSQPSARRDIADTDESEWSTELQAAIHRNWLRPSGPQIPDDFSCEVLVTLTRSGIVEDARIVRSCGHETLDASVLSAIQAASPLPLPSDMAAFNESLLLTFIPR